ncbi:MAG: YbjN domain-containing protein [Thermoleophilaceae bacterium]
MNSSSLDDYLAGVGARSLTGGSEWGLTVEAEWPLDIGIRLADGLLRVQAYVLPASRALADAELLHWNRHTRLVRFGRTRDGDIWVHGDLPAAAATPDELDRLLGLVVEAARAARRPR